MTTPSVTERLAFDAVRAWGAEAIRLAAEMSAGGVVAQKTDAYDVVTPADGAIERYLREQVRATFPDHAFLGEEEGGASGAHHWQWIVDPIDGTLNYSTGLAGPACSIACRHDGELVVGAIGDMTSGTVYRALAGSGTILASDASGERTCQPSTSAVARARVFLEFGWEDLDQVMVDTITALSTTRPRVIRMVGGAAYALENIALRGGCFLGIGLRIWDVAAGVVLAREAGLEVRMWEGGASVHLIVGTADDLRELSPIVERFGTSRAVPAA